MQPEADLAVAVTSDPDQDGGRLLFADRAGRGGELDVQPYWQLDGNSELIRPMEEDIEELRKIGRAHV